MKNQMRLLYLNCNYKLIIYSRMYGLLWWLRDKESNCSEGDMGLIPGWRRSPGEGNGNPIQCSYMEILWTEEPGGLQSTAKESDMTQQLNNNDLDIEVCVCVCVCVRACICMRSVMCSFLFVALCEQWTVVCQALLCPWGFPGKGNRVGCYYLHQGIFRTQGSTLVSSISCIGGQILYHCTTWGSPVHVCTHG